MADLNESVPVFSDAFTEAMKRVEAKRLMPEPVKQKLLRRSALMQHEMPNTNFAVFNFIGWVHTQGKLRPVKART
jgi:predicted molibdopterin-dependent oxidoreductase YjgC